MPNLPQARLSSKWSDTAGNEQNSKAYIRQVYRKRNQVRSVYKTVKSRRSGCPALCHNCDNKRMRITPADLTPEPLSLQVQFRPGVIEYTPDIRQTGALEVRGTAERIEERRGPHDIVDDIRLRASMEGDFELLCARCLDPIKYRARLECDLIFRPEGADAEQGERAISEAETEIGYYDKSGLLLEDAVREQVLLALPDRSLCREDCKGLCPHCGGNLNDVTCHCGHPVVDPRWSALQGLAGSLKS